MIDKLTELLLPIIVAVFGSTGFWSYIQSKKDKSKEIMDAINGIKTDVADVKTDMINLKANIEQTEAMNCRNRIVRFADEVRYADKTGTAKASKDYFDHIMHDIDTYTLYCKDHQEFVNGIAEVSIKKIKQAYENGEFL